MHRLLMRSTTLPSLRVPAEFRKAALEALEDGESLSAFMYESIRKSIQQRKWHQEFIARGLESAAKAKKTGRYYSAEQVLDELERKLARAKRKRR